MTQTEKLRQRLLEPPAEMSFSDVRQVLEAAGWTMSRIEGSHHLFTKAGSRTLSIPRKSGKVKRVYLRQIAGELNRARGE